jgi:hypothetical protein
MAALLKLGVDPNKCYLYGWGGVDVRTDPVRAPTLLFAAFACFLDPCCLKKPRVQLLEDREKIIDLLMKAAPPEAVNHVMLQDKLGSPGVFFATSMLNITASESIRPSLPGKLLRAGATVTWWNVPPQQVPGKTIKTLTDLEVYSLEGSYLALEVLLQHGKESGFLPPPAEHKKELIPILETLALIVFTKGLHSDEGKKAFYKLELLLRYGFNEVMGVDGENLLVSVLDLQGKPEPPHAMETATEILGLFHKYGADVAKASNGVQLLHVLLKSDQKPCLSSPAMVGFVIKELPTEVDSVATHPGT